MRDESYIRCLLLTPGEPSGIGPDIVLKAAMRDHDAEIFAIGDPELLHQRAKLLNINVELFVHDELAPSGKSHKAGTLNVIPVPLKTSSQPGQPVPTNSAYVLECLNVATNYCLNNKSMALVTGPVHKAVINKAGFDFTGHTEYLAALSNARPVMMLATQTLRVALVTTHLPLKLVSESITAGNIEYTVQTADNFLKHNCKIENPHILVCGLNPHAGENGYLGNEEIDVIIPALEKCRSYGINVTGPLSADTAFTPRHLDSADMVIAMYHDQGLPVLKHSGFGKAVNVTLGLPFIRTSVDHGTALELAGSGKASEDSLLAAIEMAARLHSN